MRPRELELPVHLSVQANLSNWEAIAFYSRYVETVVAARELSLEQLASLANAIESWQPCNCAKVLRGHDISVLDLEFVAGFSVPDDVFAPAWLVAASPVAACVVFAEAHPAAPGVTVLKIEGRGRGADYVATVTRAYREAVDLWKKGETPTRGQLERWRQALLGVFNRQFWEGGYYYGEQSDIWAGDRDSQATVKKHFVGIITHYYAHPKVAEILLQAGNLRPGDRILITGPTTGAVEYTVPSIQHDGMEISSAEIGDDVTFPYPEKLRPNDKVFTLHTQNRKKTNAHGNHE